MVNHWPDKKADGVHLLFYVSDYKYYELIALYKGWN